MMPSGPEWLIVLVVVLVLFGSTKIPALFRSLGQAQNEFKKGQQEGLPKDETPSS
jgi:sec-independent protein translocase protein TatA